MSCTSRFCPQNLPKKIPNASKTEVEITDLCILIGSVSDGNVQYDCNKNVLVETLHTYIRQFPNNYSRKLKI